MSNLRKMRRALAYQAPPLTPSEAELVRRQLPADPEACIVSNPLEIKMSEVLKEFAGPIISTVETHHDLEQCLRFAMLAWNYSLVTTKEQGKLRADLMAKCPDAIVLETFDFLVARKLSQFADIQRLILEIELRPEGADYRLDVTSSG